MHFDIDLTLLARAHLALAAHPRLYWVVGGSGSGKTTVCPLVAARHGLLLYDMDAHIYGTYHERFSPQRHPANTAWAGAPDSLAWLLDMTWEEFDRFNQAALPEYLDLLVEDLSAMAPTAGVLVDGGIFNPALLARAIPPQRIVCLEAPGQTGAAVWEDDAERLTMKDNFSGFPDPDAAWRKFLTFDENITRTIYDECLQAGIPIILRKAHSTPAETEAQVAAVFGLERTSL